VVNYACVPKHTLGTDGILARLKGRDQAQRVIQVYREAGDDRPFEQMGFEFTRTHADGQEETQVILISDLLTAAQELHPLEGHCVGCVANALKRPFGCFGRINYPLTDHAERWLLLQLPAPSDAPLVWSLLGETLRELNERICHGGKHPPARCLTVESVSEPTPTLGRNCHEWHITSSRSSVHAGDIPAVATLLSRFCSSTPSHATPTTQLTSSISPARCG
jgi:hypothetical protein